MALETYPPYALDEYAIRVFDRLGISEVEGTKWLNAGFGPLLIEEFCKHGATLEAAKILRAVGKGTHSLKLAIEIGMSPTELLSSIEADTLAYHENLLRIWLQRLRDLLWI